MDILNIELEEYVDTTVRYTYTDKTTKLPIDISGYNALLQIRPNFGNPNILDELRGYDPNTELPPPDPFESYILMGGATGTLFMIFTPKDTNQMNPITFWTRGVYDLVLTDPAGKKTKVLKGLITIARSASF